MWFGTLNTLVADQPPRFQPVLPSQALTRIVDIYGYETCSTMARTGASLAGGANSPVENWCNWTPLETRREDLEAEVVDCVKWLAQPREGLSDIDESHLQRPELTGADIWRFFSCCLLLQAVNNIHNLAEDPEDI